MAWFAFVVAADGTLSLVLDVEVVDVPGAGPLVGPIAVAGAALALFGMLGPAGRRRAGVVGVESAVVVAFAMVAIGAIGYAVVRGSAPDALLYAARASTSVFTLAAALLAFVAGVICATLVGAREAGARRPRWPWERDDEP